MDNERVILHSDMNSFYASVEMMLNPEFKGKPVAVCGSTEERHGIVLAKSDLAKKAGVKTGMVNWEARQLCPGLIVVPPQYDQYLKYSKLARQIYHRYTDLVEPYGMDECWLGVCGTGMEIAEAIRQTTKEELGLTVSIGVSFNKIFAKLGSDMRKPDAITEIKWDNFKEKIWPLDAASYFMWAEPQRISWLNTESAPSGIWQRLLRIHCGICWESMVLSSGCMQTERILLVLCIRTLSAPSSPSGTELPVLLTCKRRKMCFALCWN